MPIFGHKEQSIHVSIRDQIAPLEELATIDADLRRLEEQIGKQRGSLEGMRSEAKELEARLRADRDMFAMMEKTRGELGVELRQMTQQIERSREKLQRSRNERENNAAQREIEELRKLHRDREEEIERLTSATEAAKKSIEATETKLRGLQQQVEGTSEGTTRDLAELESQLTARKMLRDIVVKKLPVALYRRYESVRSRRRSSSPPRRRPIARVRRSVRWTSPSNQIALSSDESSHRSRFAAAGVAFAHSQTWSSD